MNELIWETQKIDPEKNQAVWERIMASKGSCPAPQEGALLPVNRQLPETMPETMQETMPQQVRQTQDIHYFMQMEKDSEAVYGAFAKGAKGWEGTALKKLENTARCHHQTLCALEFLQKGQCCTMEAQEPKIHCMAKALREQYHQESQLVGPYEDYAQRYDDLKQSFGLMAEQKKRQLDYILQILAKKL